MKNVHFAKDVSIAAFCNQTEPYCFYSVRSYYRKSSPDESRSRLLTLLVCFSTSLQCSEIDRIKKENDFLVLVHHQRQYDGYPWDDDAHSIRGLGDVWQRVDRIRSIQLHRKIVLDEQKRLQDEGRSSYALALCKISSMSSRASRSRAVALAKKDAMSLYREHQPRHQFKNVFEKISDWFQQARPTLVYTCAAH